MMMEFRPLTAGEVECRVSTINEKGLSLLLYKDARCDMRVLDETVGAENWQRRHYECKGNLFCEVGINCGGNWIWKSDCGSESYTEKEKGEASDSFKRACFNWGIGRELYTAPFIWIASDKYKAVEKSGKLTTYDKFKCTFMNVVDGNIVALNIENVTQRKTVFVFGNIFPETDFKCSVCGKEVAENIAVRSMQANTGIVFCSGTCKKAVAQ